MSALYSLVSQTATRHEDFTKESLFLNPYWVHEGMRTIGLQAVAQSADVEDAEVCVGIHKKKMSLKFDAADTTAQQKEHQAGKVLNVSKGNHQKFLKDATDESTSLLTLIKACTKKNDLCNGSRIHADIVKRGLLEKNMFLGSTLINMYVKCGALANAHKVFDELPIRDLVSWTALIAGYAKHGCGEEAIKCFEQMQLQGISPDAFTFACILKACGSIGALDKGQELHADIIREGLLEKDIVVGNALMDMYGKCGALAKAQEVFDDLPLRDVVSWNALMAGYVQHGLIMEAVTCFKQMPVPDVVSWNVLIAGHAQFGKGREAIKCYDQMQLKGFSPNTITFACVLKACGNIEALEKGQEIHAEISRQHVLAKSVVVGTALVDMYAKCGALAKAQEVFSKLDARNAVSWTALIAGYTQHGHEEEAINYFEQMRLDGLSPNAFTFACMLKACGAIGAAYKGQEIHARIISEGLLEKDNAVGNALVDMYAKCGLLRKAQEVFDELVDRDVISWNALIAGYALLGKDPTVFNFLNKMRREGEDPDLVTFTILLNTCCHSGLLDKGQMYFKTMSTYYGIIPTLEHYTCMIDLFGRAGLLQKAMMVVKKMPFFPNHTVWHNLLGACQKWGNVELGKLAFKHAVQWDEQSAESYICMSNIYAAAGMFDDAS